MVGVSGVCKKVGYDFSAVGGYEWWVGVSGGWV